jgi:hypothetical protein
METKRCEQCGAENAEAARFCSRCGRAWEGVWIRSTTRVTPIVQRWRRIRPRMTRKELRALLGEPARIETVQLPGEPPRERWTYEYEVVGRDTRLIGEVRLDLEEGTVRGWSEPPWQTVGEGSENVGT